MILSLSSQAIAFILSALTGLLVGVFFDLFRVARKLVRHKATATTIEDAVFWLFSTLFMFYLLQRVNSGEMRFYLFLGAALGAILYLMTLSPLFIKFALALALAVTKAVLFVISPIEALFKFCKKGLKLGGGYVKVRGVKIYRRMKRGCGNVKKKFRHQD